MLCTKGNKKDCKEKSVLSNGVEIVKKMCVALFVLLGFPVAARHKDSRLGYGEFCHSHLRAYMAHFMLYFHQCPAVLGLKSARCQFQNY